MLLLLFSALLFNYFNTTV
uniref:Uncharacterized protein n=1 Tax=Anguilla anguilla TaxID=7936 RepID=A0A0E9TM24_ANGAN